MKRGFVPLGNVLTEVMTFGCWVQGTSATLKKIILVLPGNPGIIGFYQEFMKSLHKDVCGIPVWGVSYVGFCLPPGSTRNSQQNQSKEVLSTTEAEIHDNKQTDGDVISEERVSPIPQLIKEEGNSSDISSENSGMSLAAANGANERENSSYPYTILGKDQLSAETWSFANTEPPDSLQLSDDEESTSNTVRSDIVLPRADKIEHFTDIIANDLLLSPQRGLSPVEVSSSPEEEQVAHDGASLSESTSAKSHRFPGECCPWRCCFSPRGCSSDGATSQSRDMESHGGDSFTRDCLSSEQGLNPYDPKSVNVRSFLYGPEPPDARSSPCGHESPDVRLLPCDPVSSDVRSGPFDPETPDIKSVPCDPNSVDVRSIPIDFESPDLGSVPCDPVSADVGSVQFDPETPDIRSVPCDPNSVDVASVPLDSESPDVGPVPCDPVSVDVMTFLSDSQTPDVRSVPSDPETLDVKSVPSDPEAPDVRSIPSDPETPDVRSVPSDIETPDARPVASDCGTPDVRSVPYAPNFADSKSVPLPTDSPDVGSFPCDLEFADIEPLPLAPESPDVRSVRCDPESTDGRSLPSDPNSAEAWSVPYTTQSHEDILSLCDIISASSNMSSPLPRDLDSGQNKSCAASTEIDLYTLDDQIEYMVTFIKTFIPQNTKIILIGHSTGCAILLEVLKRMEGIRIFQRSYMIFPTLEMLAESPNGSRLKYMMTHLSRVLDLIPQFLLTLPKRIMDKTIRGTLNKLSHGKAPDCCKNAFYVLLHKNVIRNAYFLGADELAKVRSLDVEALKKHSHLLTLYFGTTDGWVPLSCYDHIQLVAPEVRTILDDTKMNHIFMFEWSDVMAERVAGWVKEDSLDKQFARR